MNNAFRSAVIRAALDPQLITPHVLRHTAITRLVKAGIDLPTIQKISGHKTMAMVLRYAHVHAPHVDAAVDRLAVAELRLIARDLGLTTQKLHSAPGNGESEAPAERTEFVNDANKLAMVPRGGIEPPTRGFSVPCSTN
jgi:hypothetical protein